MSSKFYEVTFFDKKENQNTSHFVLTTNIEEACRKIMQETPYINVLSWKQVNENDLPDLVVVIQK